MGNLPENWVLAGLDLPADSPIARDWMVDGEPVIIHTVPGNAPIAVIQRALERATSIAEYLELTGQAGAEVLVRRRDHETLLDARGTEHYRPAAGGGWQPRTHFSGIPVQRTHFSGIVAQPGLAYQPQGRNGPFGGPAVGPMGQPLRPPGASPFA